MIATSLMPKSARPGSAEDFVSDFFNKASQKVYTRPELADVLHQNRQTWHLPEFTKLANFISLLAKHGLRTNRLRSKAYGREIVRFSWGKASPLELAMSISPRGYFCHAAALMLHGLVKNKPRALHLNVEQSVKGANGSSLTQAGIDRAFSGDQRQSNLIYTCNRVPVIMIAGKNTNRLGVERMSGPASEVLQVTNIERTLIDIVVRPVYAGGPTEILQAYRLAKDRTAPDRLLAILKELDYLYPYHQAIGFLMARAGYPIEICAKLREVGVHYDFHLAHRMREREYSKEWRLFYPRDLT